MQFLAFLYVAFFPLRQMGSFLREFLEYIPRLKLVDYFNYAEVDGDRYRAP